MNTLSVCPCCSDRLIHYLKDYREYWFCRHCWSEMPNLEALKADKNYNPAKIVKLPVKLPKFHESVLAVL